MKTFNDEMRAFNDMVLEYDPMPLNEQPAYQHLCCPDCTSVASKVAKQVLSLPMSADLRLDEQHTIIQALI